MSRIRCGRFRSRNYLERRLCRSQDGLADAVSRRKVDRARPFERWSALLERPLLFIYGGRDALVDTPATLTRASALNPRIQSKVFADAGHASFIEEPDRFNRDLTEFVSSVSGK
ncbi:alpha/beta fold hydrolase [Paraburkholderia sp. BR14374]|uniref:alpha/beta fold hydrolase n=1 Tax=Paraburkholderia sp. BR14374 TaxID=3237007 RepID=UPI0034D00628